MPKRIADYPARIDFFATNEMRRKLIAIAYHMGFRGTFSKSARILLDEAIDGYLNKLKPKERKRFNEILKNVAFQEAAEEDLG